MKNNIVKKCIGIIWKQLFVQSCDLFEQYKETEKGGKPSQENQQNFFMLVSNPWQSLIMETILFVISQGLIFCQNKMDLAPPKSDPALGGFPSSRTNERHSCWPMHIFHEKVGKRIGVIGFTHFLDPWVHWPFCKKFDIQSIVRYKKELYFGSIYWFFDDTNPDIT